MSYKNPYGVLKNNILIHIEKYNKEMGEVLCPVCKGELIYCDGKVITSYFKHKCENIRHTESEYSIVLENIQRETESIQHKEMKRKLIEEKKIPLRCCRSCKKYEEKNLEDYNEWKEEVKWQNFIIDVVAYRPNNLFEDIKDYFFIEVVHSHKCSKEKYMAFEECGVDWMEVNCEGKYLRGNYICTECKNLILKFTKYKGKTIYEVLRFDKDYCLWMYLNIENLYNNILSVLEKEFGDKYREDRKLCLKYNKIINAKRSGDIKLLKEREELFGYFNGVFDPAKCGVAGVCGWDVLWFGKHIDKSVYEVEKSYLKWLYDNSDIVNNNKILKFFVVDALLC